MGTRRCEAWRRGCCAVWVRVRRRAEPRRSLWMPAVPGIQQGGGDRMAKDHGSSVINDKQYEGMRKKGMSKERAAKISNANAGSDNAASKKGGKNSGGGGSNGGGAKSQKAAAGRK